MTDNLFREEVRAFLERALTPDIVRAGELMTSVFADYDATMKWHRALHSQGWIAPDWPVWRNPTLTMQRPVPFHSGIVIRKYTGHQLTGTHNIWRQRALKKGSDFFAEQVIGHRLSRLKI